VTGRVSWLVCCPVCFDAVAKDKSDKQWLPCPFLNTARSGERTQVVLISICSLIALCIRSGRKLLSQSLPPGGVGVMRQVKLLWCAFFRYKPARSVVEKNAKS
jgi:hypothetical protein